MGGGWDGGGGGTVDLMTVQEGMQTGFTMLTEEKNLGSEVLDWDMEGPRGMGGGGLGVGWGVRTGAWQGKGGYLVQWGVGGRARGGGWGGGEEWQYFSPHLSGRQKHGLQSTCKSTQNFLLLTCKP